MVTSEKPIRCLEPEECWQLLDTRQVGRLATAVDRRPDIMPVNYVRDGHNLYFRTAPGTKLLALTINSSVAFEVDDWVEDFGGWSVVCHGHATVVEDEEDLRRLSTLGLRPWTATLKPVHVKIAVTEVTGRRFDFGPEPEQSWT